MKTEYFDTVSSTNAVAKQRAAEGAGETVIIASRQTSGRGRMQRMFASPTGGLYFSVLLRPDIGISSLLKLTSLAAVETSLAIEEFTRRRTQIKWVNDLLLDGKKVCGILTECGFDGEKMSFAVVGIGINLGRAPDGVDGAGGLECEETDKIKLAQSIASRISEGIKKIDSGYFLDEYRARMCLIGRKIYVIKGSDRFKAVAEGVDDMCALKVAYADGTREMLNTFEVSIRQTDE